MAGKNMNAGSGKKMIYKEGKPATTPKAALAQEKKEGPKHLAAIKKAIQGKKK